MGCGCIGRRKSRDAIESETEDEIEDEIEEEEDCAAGFSSDINYEVLSEQELQDMVRSTYEDFLKCQGLDGTPFKREDFERRFAEYVACERTYLKRLGIDHNDTKKVKSVLDPILEGAGTGSVSTKPSTSHEESSAEDLPGSHGPIDCGRGGCEADPAVECPTISRGSSKQGLDGVSSSSASPLADGGSSLDPTGSMSPSSNDRANVAQKQESASISDDDPCAASRKFINGSSATESMSGDVTRHSSGEESASSSKSNSSAHLTDGAPSPELSSVTASSHGSGQDTRGWGSPHRYRVEVRYSCYDYRGSSL